MERYRAGINHLGAVHHNERAAAVERCVAGGIEIDGHITGVVGASHLIDFNAIDGIGKGGYLVVIVEYLAERIPVIGVERMGGDGRGAVTHLYFSAHVATGGEVGADRIAGIGAAAIGGDGDIIGSGLGEAAQLIGAEGVGNGVAGAGGGSGIENRYGKALRSGSCAIVPAHNGRRACDVANLDIVGRIATGQRLAADTELIAGGGIVIAIAGGGELDGYRTFDRGHTESVGAIEGAQQTAVGAHALIESESAIG